MSIQARDDESWMSEALAIAARVPARPWPNPPVGAVVVDACGEIVGRGAHLGPGTRHAEVVALEEAGERARSATLYCTLEPCNHEGRTPPCAPRVAASGVRRVVVGVRDPNPRVAGGGLACLAAMGIDVIVGVAGAAALELIWPFVTTDAFARPFVLLKTATSLDGRFAPAARPAGPGAVYLTSDDARREVHRLRRWSDAVLVGSRTMIADRPSLDGHLVGDGPCPATDPIPAYVDTDLGVDPHWHGRACLAFAARGIAPAERVNAVRDAGATVILCKERGGHVHLRSLVDALPPLGIHVLLVEGGPTLARALLAARLVDRWVSFVAPIVLGSGVVWPDGHPPAPDDGGLPHRYSLTRCAAAGPDVHFVHDAASFHETLVRLTAPLEA